MTACLFACCVQQRARTAEPMKWFWLCFLVSSATPISPSPHAYSNCNHTGTASATLFSLVVKLSSTDQSQVSLPVYTINLPFTTTASFRSEASTSRIPAGRCCNAGTTQQHTARVVDEQQQQQCCCLRRQRPAQRRARDDACLHQQQQQQQCAMEVPSTSRYQALSSTATPLPSVVS